MSVEVTVLENGLRVVTDSQAHLESACIGIWVDAGARNETPEMHGVAYLLEHMAFKGTKERSARDIKVDSDEVWGTSASDADEDEAKSSEKGGGAKSKGSATDDTKSLERKDAFQRMFSPSGAIAAAILDAEHWLCAGASPSVSDESKLPVMVTGSNVLMSKYPVRAPVRLADADDLRLSGLLWPEARARMANSAYATVERVGNGQIMLFASDPFFRGYFEATGRLFLNAMLHGPGLGARQSVPW